MTRFQEIVTSFISGVMTALVVIAVSVAHCAEPANVAVVRGEDYTTGSGFVIAVGPKTSIIATNYHVCVGNYRSIVFNLAHPKYLKIKVTLANGDEKMGDVVETSRYSDLCLVRIEGTYRPLPLSRGLRLAPGEPLEIAPPQPFKYHSLRYIGPDKSADQWAESHLGSEYAAGSCIEGMSGSAILNRKGKVVGVLWGCSNKIGFTYFVPFSKLKRLLEKLDSKYKVLYN